MNILFNINNNNNRATNNQTKKQTLTRIKPGIIEKKEEENKTKENIPLSLNQ